MMHSIMNYLLLSDTLAHQSFGQQCVFRDQANVVADESACLLLEAACFGGFRVQYHTLCLQRFATCYNRKKHVNLTPFYHIPEYFPQQEFWPPELFNYRSLQQNKFKLGGTFILLPNIIGAIDCTCAVVVAINQSSTFPRSILLPQSQAVSLHQCPSQIPNAAVAVLSFYLTLYILALTYPLQASIPIFFYSTLLPPALVFTHSLLLRISCNRPLHSSLLLAAILSAEPYSATPQHFYNKFLILTASELSVIKCISKLIC